MIFSFLYYFSSFHFIFIHISFLFFFFSFFFFLLFSSTQDTEPPSFYFLFHLKNIPTSHICFTSETERERERVHAAPPPAEIEVAKRTKPVEISVHPRPPPHRCSLSSPPLGWVRSACSFFLFFIFACSDSTLF